MAQAFDRVWHKGLTYRLTQYLPKQYFQILESYITDRYFKVKQEEAYLELKKIRAGELQGSVLDPALYLLYTCDIPTIEIGTIATFADDTAILAVGETIKDTTGKPQTSVNKIYEWTRKWRIKLNKIKSGDVDFTNKNVQHLPVILNNKKLPYSNSDKYLGITLDAKLMLKKKKNWKYNTKKCIA